MNVEAKQRFAQIVAGLRAGRSYRSFAKLIGVSHPTIKAWENCEGNPDAENLEKIAEMLGQSLPEFKAFLENEPNQLDRVIAEIKSIPGKDLPMILKIIAERLENT